MIRERLRDLVGRRPAVRTEVRTVPMQQNTTMVDDIRKPLLRQRATEGLRTNSGVKLVPGPTLRDDGGMMPCGCKVDVDPAGNARFGFCAPHELAQEMLGSLQAIRPVLDDMVNNVNANYDTTTAMEAGIKLRKVLQRATGGWR